MKERLKAFFLDWVVPIFYRVERVEYIRFCPENRSWWSEYLILYYSRRISLWRFPKSHEVVNASIDFKSGEIFASKVERFREGKRQVSSRTLSLEEFAQVAKFHPLLKKDPWVSEFLPKLLAKPWRTIDTR